MKSIEESLLDAVKLVEQEGGTPDDAWVQGYGQVLKDGKWTEVGIKWQQEIKNEIK